MKFCGGVLELSPPLEGVREAGRHVPRGNVKGDHDLVATRVKSQRAPEIKFRPETTMNGLVFCTFVHTSFAPPK